MKNRFEVLDGWRGISILFVLAGHLLPLGLKSWEMNAAIAASGMAIFFILSGFLITNILIKKPDIRSFLIRRFMRILPLAWLVLAITLFFVNASAHQVFSGFFFYANWPPMGLTFATSHFWSLCVEVQFYVLIALLVYSLKEKAFWLLPGLCIGVTVFRAYHGVEMAINTYFRIDEILAGCILALVYNFGSSFFKSFIGKLNSFFFLILLIMSAHPTFELLNYFRPYIALLLVGSTLFSVKDSWLISQLRRKELAYIAGISYALYVIHGVLGHTWLGEGDLLEKYAKRPLLFLLTFLLAHISTKYYESYWIKLGIKLTSNHNQTQDPNEVPVKPARNPN